MKAFLIISLFILISSKDNAIEFAKEIPFDNNNAKFEFTYDKNDNIFIKVTTNDRCKMNFDAIIHSYATDISKPGTSIITQKELVSSSYKIEFEPDKYGPKTFNGTFWINPSLLEVKIDINSKVEWNYFTFTAKDELPKLTYSLDNAEKDVTFIFKYSYDNKKDITNQKFGLLTVIEMTNKRNINHGIICKCKCECGNIIEVASTALRSGHTTSCGCIKSRGEQIINNLLISNQIPFTREKTFSDCVYPETNSKLKFDFFINNNFLLEFDGIQHFKSVGGWNTEEKVQQTQLRDNYKNQWAKENNIPLKRIPYWKLNDLTIEDIMSDEYLIT